MDLGQGVQNFRCTRGRPGSRRHKRSRYRPLLWRDAMASGRGNFRAGDYVFESGTYRQQCWSLLSRVPPVGVIRGRVVDLTSAGGPGGPPVHLVPPGWSTRRRCRVTRRSPVVSGALGGPGAGAPPAAGGPGGRAGGPPVAVARAPAAAAALLRPCFPGSIAGVRQLARWRGGCTPLSPQNAAGTTASRIARLRKAEATRVAVIWRRSALRH